MITSKRFDYSVRFVALVLALGPACSSAPAMDSNKPNSVSAGAAAVQPGVMPATTPSNTAMPSANAAGSTSPRTSSTAGKGSSWTSNGVNPGNAGSAAPPQSVSQAGASGAKGMPVAGAMAVAGTGGAMNANTGSCTVSMPASSNATGSGPHKVVVETNADPGINEGTIIRPMDLGGAEKYPIFAWGEGGCAQQGLSNASAVGEIASHGYFVIADGPPSGGKSNRSMGDTVSMGKPLLAYIAWAIAENSKPCSAYFQSLDTTKVATAGFSCGGLMAEGTAGDPGITTWMLNSSGLFSADQALYKSIHTPVLIVLGGSDDIAYQNGKRDYDNISALGIPIMLFSKALGHGGDLFQKNGGSFTSLDLAWLNWWLKGDQSETGKGFLVGDKCSICKDSAWETASKNVP